MYKRSTYINKITRHLMLLSLTIQGKNSLFLTDDNKWSENFFKKIINKIYDYNLVNLNTKEANYAGIDLGDDKNRICIQVTADNSSEKIQESINISEKYRRYEDYDRVIILMIGKFKKNYIKKFESKKFIFNKDTDIWDVKNLLVKISNIEDIEKIKDIVEFLDSELETVLNIDPIELLEEDIALIIDLLFKHLKLEGHLRPFSKKFKITKRGDNFIKHKNAVNNVDDVFFNDEIRPSISFCKKIETFLGDPINIEYQNKYFSIVDRIQKIYLENTEEFKNIGSLFGHIFDQIINYKNRTIVDDQKLLIILHNMYFNCDIGNNPSKHVNS